MPADKILYCEHHLSHAASAFLCAPYDDAATLTVDGVGEWATAAIGRGRRAPFDLSLDVELRYPHSLGLLYSAFTAYLGFEVNEGEYKVMGLAPYGTPRFADAIRGMIEPFADGSFRLDLDWFVLRPSLIYGHGGKSAALFMRLASLPMIPVIGDGKQNLQPVHISDVVATVLTCLRSTEARKTLDIVGEQTITFAEWLQTMRHAQSLPRARELRIPFALAMAGAYLGRYLNPILQPENLRMLKKGYWADVQPLARFLGRMPLRVEPALFFSDLGRDLIAGSKS